MKLQPEITYRHLEKTNNIENLIAEKIAKLEQFCDYINSCHVVVEKDNDRPSSGSPYRVSIDITIPHGREIAVVESPDKGKQYPPLETVIRDAFEAARRQLVSITTEQKGERKVHPEQETSAIVDRLFPEDGYGFLKTVDTGRDIYFHQNSVVDGFEKITVGTGVRFTETMGEMGPQASTVKILDNHAQRNEGRNTDNQTEATETPLGWS